MVHRRRSTITSCAGHGVASGKNLFRELARNGRSAETQMIDSTHVKAHRSASGGKGGSRTGCWPSRGGRNTKIHALADANGCSATRPTTVLNCATSCPNAEPSRSSPTAATGSSHSASANASTSFTGASRLYPTGSRTSGASQPDTTGWLETI